MSALVGKVKQHLATGPRRMKITSIRKRRLDLDNLWGGVKQLVDACKMLKLILDDSPAYLRLECEQKIQKIGAGTIIEIEDEI